MLHRIHFFLLPGILLAQQSAAPPELPVIHERIVITATPLGPEIEPKSAEAFRETLFSRDDQVLQLVEAGINAGQHEGGGKSLEIRRYGFNLDHGGVNLGVRVLVDNVPQNHGTQGHGQGYLGSLKTVSPELIEEVTLINGPFSAEHGDYSGLGVVHILQRESMPDVLTLRAQGGNYGTRRVFVAWSPSLQRRDAVFAYDGSYSDGPFLKPLDYRRDNVTGSYTWVTESDARIGLKWNGGLNRFHSSGQLPTDEIAAGRLDPYGSLSEGDGGYVQSGRVGAYYRRGLGSSLLKMDGFVERSLFDLYSNFTFYLNNPVNGDAIQQHDSRLSEGANVQYLRPHVFRWGSGVLSAGANLVASQNMVELRQVVNRDPIAMMTSAHANVTNGAGYIQEELDLAGGKLQLGGGLRFDVFRYGITDRLEPEFTGTQTTALMQPKVNISMTPSYAVPVKLFFQYGRGIASIDARGAARQPDGPLVGTNDFFEGGFSYKGRSRFSVVADLFLIHSSHQLVYIPDDGTIEFADPSRSYGFEVKTTFELTPHLGFSGGLTKVLNGYYRGTAPRVYLDSAPRFTGNAALTLSRWQGWTGSLRMRAINHYRLDGEDPSLIASGHTVFDLAFARSLGRNLELNFALDNLLDRFYWETQNYFESRLAGQGPMERVHATPSYGRTVMVGLTVKLGGK